MRNHGPWKITGSKVKYKNKWLKIREDLVTRPDGKPGIFGVVKMAAGASVLPIDADGNVYLTKEFRYAIGQNSIEVVSGGIDTGETPLEAAKRELKEELGCKAGIWTEIGIMNPFTSVVYSPAHLFLANDLSFSETENEGTEIIASLKMPLTEAVKMVMDSKITHGQSSVLILKAFIFLNHS